MTYDYGALFDCSKIWEGFAKMNNQAYQKVAIGDDEELATCFDSVKNRAGDMSQVFVGKIQVVKKHATWMQDC